jgi:hypothetical protein
MKAAYSLFLISYSLSDLFNAVPLIDIHAYQRAHVANFYFCQRLNFIFRANVKAILLASPYHSNSKLVTIITCTFLLPA